MQCVDTSLLPCLTTSIFKDYTRIVIWGLNPEAGDESSYKWASGVNITDTGEKIRFRMCGMCGMFWATGRWNMGRINEMCS